MSKTLFWCITTSHNAEPKALFECFAYAAQESYSADQQHYLSNNAAHQPT